MTDGVSRVAGSGVTPHRATCIECHHPFDSNGELASIPDARRIAFDPGHHRVWRICTTCGTWNLLGAEASAVAMPELEARFDAAPRAATSDDFAPAIVGPHLELIRLGEHAPRGTNHFAALRRRRTLDRTSLIAMGITILAGVVIATVALLMLFQGVLVLGVAEYLTAIPLYNLGRELQCWRYHVPVGRQFVLVNAVVLSIGLIATAIAKPVGALVVLPLFAAVIAIIAWNHRPMAVLIVPMMHPPDVLFRSREAIAQVSMSWNADTGNIQLFDLPMGQDASGAEAAEILHSIVQHRYLSPFRRRSATESAYNLLQAVGDLRGLLRALDGFRRDHDDRITFADLPPIYQVALDLALATPVPHVGTTDEFGRQAREAAAIAAEAEALDGTMRGDDAR
jgi:hypothetical protein